MKSKQALNQKIKSKLRIRLFLIVLAIIVVGYFLLFTTNYHKPTVLTAASRSVVLLGDTSLVHKIKKNAGNGQISQLPKTHCARIKAGCEEAFRKREESKSYFDDTWNSLTPEEDQCLVDGCLEWQDGSPFGQTEEVVVDLSGEQLTEIVRQYKPSYILASNIVFWIENEKVYGALTSYYPFLPGELTGEAEISDGWFTVEKAAVGRISIVDPVVENIDHWVEYYFVDYLGKVGVTVEKIELVNNRLRVYAQAPVGLVKMENETLIIDNAKLAPFVDQSGNQSSTEPKIQ